MKNLIIILLAIPLLFGCSKEEEPNEVSIEYIVLNGNIDGILSVKKADNTIIEVAKGPNAKSSDIVSKDFIFHANYRTSQPLPEGFKLIVRVGEKSKETYFLSEILQPNTYVNEGNVKNL